MAARLVGPILSRERPKMADHDTDDHPSPAPLETFLTYRLARVQSKLNAQATRILRDHAGITLTQWRILAVIGDAGSCTAAQLSRNTSMDKGLISRNVKTLIAQGFLSSQRDAFDNRAQHLDLTDKGQDVYQRTIPRMRDRQTALRAYLTPDDEAVLLRVFDNLERACDDPSI
jgi:DNA-binding MarR family transcriptional regulator